MSGEARPLSLSRGAQLAAGAIVSVAFVGFFVGTKEASRERTWAPLVKEPAEHPAALPARTNRELAERPWGTESSWSPAPLPPPAPRVSTANLEARASALGERARHRAFAGAPPTIPHPIGQGGAQECNACHQEGMQLRGLTAPPMSHQPYTQCTQCHVVEASPIPAKERWGREHASVFEGLAAASAPLRWSAAPPQTPHGVFMRERCESCHGVYGRPGLQTSHPERTSCTQCHASEALLDQQPGAAR